MQCFNCGFENLPGMQACARCQSPLNLSTVAVAPPRASSLRIRTRLAAAWNRAGSMLQRPLWRTPLEAGSHFSFTWLRGAIVSALVPGLGHDRRGASRRGRLLLVLWLIAILSMFLTLGTAWSDWFFNGAVALHTIAVLSLLAAAYRLESIPGRLLHGLTIFLLLRFLFYSPLAGFGRQFLVPMAIVGIEPNPVIQSGDALIYQGPWLRSRELHYGDLVVYRLDRAAGASADYPRIDGFGLDRIVGLPGDHVLIQDGRLQVNGRALASRSCIGPPKHLGEFELDLGPGQYAILPSALPLRGYGLRPGAIIRNISVVAQHDVLGRVVWRMHPWSRFGRVE